jgi:hypothetical protein
MAGIDLRSEVTRFVDRHSHNLKKKVDNPGDYDDPTQSTIKWGESISSIFLWPPFGCDASVA